MSEQAEALLNEIETRLAEPELEGHIVVGKDRYVTVPDELKKIGVQHDHNIETVTFDCPRYWDGIDMSTMKIYINYMINATGFVGSYLTSGATVDAEDENLMHFDWVISSEVTQEQGAISFIVCIKTTDEDGIDIHHWNSELNMDMFISPGLPHANHILAEYPDIVTQLLIVADRANTIAQTLEDHLAAGDFELGLPIVDENDNGRILRVENGEWCADELKVYEGGVVTNVVVEGEIVQNTGDSETAVMSQKATSEAINAVAKSIPEVKTGVYDFGEEGPSDTAAVSQKALLMEFENYIDVSFASYVNEVDNRVKTLEETSNHHQGWHNGTEELIEKLRLNKNQYIGDYTGTDYTADTIQNKLWSFRGTTGISGGMHIVNIVNPGVDVDYSGQQWIYNVQTDTWKYYADYKNPEIVQETGDSETAVMSQKATSEAINAVAKSIPEVKTDLYDFGEEGPSDTAAVSQRAVFEELEQNYLGRGFADWATPLINENIDKIAILEGNVNGHTAFIETYEPIVNENKTQIGTINTSVNEHTAQITALEADMGDVETALDSIIAIQNSLIGGESE